MQTQQVWFIVALALTLSACKPALKLIYGIKNPKPLSQEQTEKGAQKLFGNNEAEAVLTYSPQKDFSYMQQEYPVVYIFDAQGNHLPHLPNLGEEAAGVCGQRLDEFLANLSPEQTYEKGDSIHLAAFSARLQHSNSSPFKIEEGEQADFYVFFIWANFFGKVAQANFRDWDTKLKANSKAKIRYFRLSQDPQKSWGEANLRALGYKKRRYWR